jgi:carbon monoxide dehydrogenase subunit G
MPEIRRTLTIDVPVDKLWATMSDLESQSKWMTPHTKFKGAVPSGADLKAGAQYTEVISLMGMDNTVEWTVQEADSPEQVAETRRGTFKISGTGMAGVEVTIALSVDGTGGDRTDVDLDANFVGQMIVGAIGTAVTKTMGDELDKSLENLQKLVAA